MKSITAILIACPLALLSACSSSEPPEMTVAQVDIMANAWRLTPSSRLHFVSVKNDSVAEVHRFTNLSGSLNPAGAFELSVGLSSVDTAIPIRDQRMRELLFKVEHNAAARIFGSINSAASEVLTPPWPKTLDLAAEMAIAGAQQPINVQLIVTQIDQRLLVSSAAPLVLNTTQLGLGDGVEALREIAGLQSISPAVPVTFHLELERVPK